MKDWKEPHKDLVKGSLVHVKEAISNIVEILPNKGSKDALKPSNKVVVGVLLRIGISVLGFVINRVLK